ncbi:MAG: DUF1302 family protein [Pseudomonadota bacterium]
MTRAAAPAYAFFLPVARGRVWLAAGLCMGAGTASAVDFSLAALDLTGKFAAQVSAGTTLRTEARSSDLVGKLNLSGQQDFCDDDPIVPPTAPGVNCTLVPGNAAYLALPGVSNSNGDNGNLNYDKGDVVNALFRFAPRLQLTHPKFGIDASAVAFYDPINDDFTEYHPNNIEDNNGFQPRNTKRSKEARKDLSLGVNLLDAFVSTDIPLPGGRDLTVKVGNQLLSLGTTTTLVLNGLNTVNPPDVNLRFLPGSDLRDVFQRVPLAVLTTSLTDSVAVTGFYQLLWKPVTLPPIGSYYSTNDSIGAGDGYAGLLFGKPREDPLNVAGIDERTPGNANLLSNASRTLFPTATRKARNGGQFGFNLNYLAGWLNNTGFDFSYLRLHSRLPTISFIASQEGCANQSNNQAEALAACRGFSTTPVVGVEPLPVDTVKYFVDYPEGIDTFGASFSTNLGSVAWTGEVTYRPNQPFQIDPVDVGFAALQPVFPRESINLGVVTLPGERVAVPDFVETIYRQNPEVLPGQVIRGSERLQSLGYNTSFLFLLGASDNVFGADQITLLVELGAQQVLNLPSLEVLQLATPGTEFHHSAGVDGSGTPTPTQAQSDPSARLNPSYQPDGFATSFSWGYRVLSQFAYEGVLPNLRLAPQFTFAHDVEGRAPLPSGEFFEDRKQATAGLNALIGDRLSTTVRYTWFFDGGRRNLLHDRDNVQLNLSYDF